MGVNYVMNEKEVLTVDQVEILKTLDSVNVDCIILRETISECKEEIENGRKKIGVLDKFIDYFLEYKNAK